VIRDIRDTPAANRSAILGMGINYAGETCAKAEADVKRKQRIEITEVENGFAVTLTTTSHYSEPRIFIATNLQQATDLIMTHAR